MAIKRAQRNAKIKISPFDGKTCRDCAHSKDWHSKALDGHMILCKCVYYTDGKWSQFLSAPACQYFVQRKDNGDE